MVSESHSDLQGWPWTESYVVSTQLQEWLVKWFLGKYHASPVKSVPMVCLMEANLTDRVERGCVLFKWIKSTSYLGKKKLLEDMLVRNSYSNRLPQR